MSSELPVNSPACLGGCFVDYPNKLIDNPFNPYVYPPWGSSPFAWDFTLDVNGLTEQEKSILESLAKAWNDFSQLEGKHPADDSEFCKAIHDAQKMIALRVARRVNPEVWKQFPETKEGTGYVG